MEAPGTDQRRQRKRRRSVAPAPIGSESGGLNQAGQIESSLLHLLEEENDDLVQEALQAMEAKEAAGRGSTEILYGHLLALGSQLQEYGKRLARQHASEMNMTTWPLTQDVTVKIFSMMGAHDCAHAAVACTLFAKTAADPACYQVLDLVPRGLHVTMATVNMLVRRAGPFLRVLKLGVLPKPPSPAAPSPCGRSVRRRSSLASSVASPGSPGPSGALMRPAWVPRYEDKTLPMSRLMLGKEKGRLCPLSKQALQVLGPTQAAAGQLLRGLHLYNVVELDAKAVTAAIAACPRLEDLEVIGLQVSPAATVEAVAEHCPLLTRLCCQPRKRSGLFDVWDQDPAGRHAVLRSVLCEKLAARCPRLASLTLRSCVLQDRKVQLLLQKLPLRYLDLCGAQYLTGTFLKDLASLRECHLEHLLLRDCMRLREDCVEAFLHALLSDECKSLRSLDVSNKNGLASGWEWFARQKSGRVEDAVARLPRLRPGCWLTADFPDVSESGSEDESDEESEDSEDDLSEAVPSSEEDSDGEEEEEDDEDEEDDELDDDYDDDDSDDDDDDEDDGDDIGGRGRRNLAKARELLQAAQQRLDSVDRTRHGLV